MRNILFGDSDRRTTDGALRATILCRNAALSHLSSFAASVAKEPARALAGSAAAFDDAALVAVLDDVIKAFERGASVEQVARTAAETTLRLARYPERSTSATANLYAEAQLAAWATLADALVGTY